MDTEPGTGHGSALGHFDGQTIKTTNSKLSMDTIKKECTVLQILAIAAVCHAANAQYCKTIGDHTQPSWEEAPDWQRESAIAGVKFRIENPDVTPAQMHENWMAQKVAEGWVYGTVKDPVAKTHHCMVPYEELPEEQKYKDALFSAVVNALL